MNDSYENNYDNNGGYADSYGSCVPTVKNYLCWYGLYFLATLLGCGIGGIVLAIVWACNNNNEGRRNWARAQLIIFAIVIVLYIVFFIFAAIFGTAVIRFGTN